MAELTQRLPWQQEQWQYIQNLRDNQRLPHALLLSGSPLIGKQQFAECLANSLLCLHVKDDGMPCGECRSCLLNIAETHPDFKLVHPETEGGAIKVDQIRTLVTFVTQTAQQGGRKVVVLYPAEAMNVNASNALLKSLEEPGRDTHLILITHRPSGLLATIRSRCQTLSFNQPTFQQVEPWLKQQALAAQLDDHDLQKAYFRSGQRPFQALRYLDSEFAAQQDQLLEGLQKLLNREITPVTLAEKWKNQPLIAVLTLFYELSCDSLKRPVMGSEMLYELALEHYFSSEQLFEWQAILLAKLNDLQSASNPNEQLLLEDVLIAASNYGKNT